MQKKVLMNDKENKVLINKRNIRNYKL